MSEEIQTTPNLRTLKNGAIYDMDKGRIVANPGGGSHAITSANASLYQQKRKEKAARLLRSRIAEETRGVSTLPIRDGAEAVAEAGAMLWKETVLDANAFPRDRLAAWETIGKHAQVLGADKTQTVQPPSSLLDRVAAVAVLLVRNGADNNYRNHDDGGVVVDADTVDGGGGGGG